VHESQHVDASPISNRRAWARAAKENGAEEFRPEG